MFKECSNFNEYCKTFLNNNICVIGGSGSGKTRFFNKPNILQMNCNYVVTDPKTSLIKETANAFIKMDMMLRLWILSIQKTQCIITRLYILKAFGCL